VLRRLARDATLRDALGANGRRTAERFFNQVEIDARFVTFLEQQGAVMRPMVERAGAATRGEVL